MISEPPESDPAVIILPEPVANLVIPAPPGFRAVGRITIALERAKPLLEVFGRNEYETVFQPDDAAPKHLLNVRPAIRLICSLLT